MWAAVERGVGSPAHRRARDWLWAAVERGIWFAGAFPPAVEGLPDDVGSLSWGAVEWGR